jgi:hypothetical protein
MNLMIKGVPEELWRQFKSVCALEGKTVKDKIIELVEKEVEKDRTGKV